MARFDYVVALNKMIGKRPTDFKLQNDDLLPEWAKGADFINEFVPYLVVVGDSREQKDWIELACKCYGIKFEKAKKDKKAGTENLKEGDYTFKVMLGNKVYDYRGVVAYERKGSISELYNNCKSGDRYRIENEFQRFLDKDYKKVVLLLEMGYSLLDLIGCEFRIPVGAGQWQTKNVGNLIFTTLMSWRQSNNKNFDIIQSEKHIELFWLMVMDMFYWFRGEIKKEWQEYENRIEKGISN